MSARFSIREISRQIGIPESTLRYYRTLFPQQIPTLGSGRNRRHPQQAVAVFRLISELFARGETRETILRRLKQSPPDVSESGPRVTRPAAGRQEVEAGSGMERSTDVAGLRNRLTVGEIEDFVATMVVRDRELMTMHRELLALVGRLIGALERQRGTRGEASDREFSTRASEAPEPEVVPKESGEDGTTADELDAGAAEPKRAAAEARAPDASAQLEQLRQSLEREREMVERLRRAKLQVEQRLARLEKETAERKR